ncbi:hypothetical protein IW262DRAFT_1478994 [Armillaria fumosa]|nr:hypothetical protein IW262DRAFT_1478994 [Armillaria fumosa]
MSHLQGDSSSISWGAFMLLESHLPHKWEPRTWHRTEDGFDIKSEGRGEREQDKLATVQIPTSKSIYGIARRPNLSAKKGRHRRRGITECEGLENAQDESRIQDPNMVEESRDNVDVLLVFASPVVTLMSSYVKGGTFFGRRHDFCRPDVPKLAAGLHCHVSVVTLRNGHHSTCHCQWFLGQRHCSFPFDFTVPFVPTAADVWVNGLWFTSLFLSLTIALVAVLVKQWLHHYVALPSGTPCDGVLHVNSDMPGSTVARPALIFLIGLVIFHYPLRAALSWITCAGTAYALATMLPILFPYRTPLCDFIYVSFSRIIPQVSWDKKSASSLRVDEKVGPHVPLSSTQTKEKLANTDDASDRVQGRETDVKELGG